MNINLLENNSVLVLPNTLKDKVLKQLNKNNKLLNIKFMTREEFIDRSSFLHDEEAILYLMDKYDYDSDVANILIDNMKYVEHDKYPSDKLNRLFLLKEELKNKNLIVRDELFRELLKNKKIYVYGYLNIDNLFKKYLDEYEYFIITNNLSLPNKKIIYRANTLEEEVEFVFSKVGDLLERGISINNIKIVNYSDKYKNVFHKLSKFYNIPIEDKGYSIYSTQIVKDYLDRLSKTKNISDTYQYINNKYNDEDASKILTVLLNISNRYNDLNYSFKNIYKLIINDIKNSKIVINNYANKIEFGELNPYFYSEDDHIFLIGFNQSELPKLYSDEDYIIDEEKSYLNMEDTNTKNKMAKDNVLFFINNTNNLLMSFPLKHLSDDYHPSNLIIENNFEIRDIELSDNSYSEIYSKIKLTKYLDDFIKYGTINPLLSKYYSNYDIDYLTYDNRFTGISRNKFLEKMDKKIVLSYSSINNYNKCHFRYYLDNVLKMNKYEDSFQVKIGNLFHHLLSICFDDDFDLDDEWNAYILKLNLDFRDRVFLKKLRQEFDLILDAVRNLHQETYLSNCLMEYKVYLDKSRDVEVGFMGVIDKCMYREKDGNTLVSLIDYKTGNTDINLDNVVYGIDMQLPIYWYLIKKGNIFENSKLVGFYLQKILHGELKRESNKSYLEMKKSNLKLIGYSTSDKSLLASFDPTFENSSFIKSMSVKKDGEFAHHAKIIDEDTMDLLVEYIDKIIEDDIDGILRGDFSINPKKIGDKLVGCDYCNYRDICYCKNEDIINLKENKGLSFLGGDDNE